MQCGDTILENCSQKPWQSNTECSTLIKYINRKSLRVAMVENYIVGAAKLFRSHHFCPNQNLSFNMCFIRYSDLETERISKDSPSQVEKTRRTKITNFIPSRVPLSFSENVAILLFSPQKSLLNRRYFYERKGKRKKLGHFW